MLCSMCHKNEAVICYTEIVNGIKKEQYLCQECAAKYTGFDSEASGITPGSLLAGLLTSVLGQAGVAAEDDTKKTNLACKNCGMTYNELLKYSKFGCPECVHTFGFILDDYLKKIQGSSEHCGKEYSGRETVFIPDVAYMDHHKDAFEKNAEDEKNMTASSATVKDTDSREAVSLKRQLSLAIKAEEYEEAARLRDAIRDLKLKEETVDEKMV